jgi:hypothetical protein
VKFNECDGQPTLVRSGLLPATKANPCPICGKTGWCSRTADGQVAICMRSDEGAFKVTRNGPPGWLHWIGRPGSHRSQPARSILAIRTPKTRYNWEVVASDLAHALSPSRAEEWAELLRLPPIAGGAALRALGCGRQVDKAGAVWATFPMRNGHGRIVGIRRRRLLDGMKLSFSGGHEGLFVPMPSVEVGVLYVVEGPTDAAAAMAALGYQGVVGRPNCTGGVQHLATWIRARRFSTVVVVPDNDKPGLDGAKQCAAMLCMGHKDVHLAAPPPAKDVRQLVAESGLTVARAWFERALVEGPRMRLRLKHQERVR